MRSRCLGFSRGSGLNNSREQTWLKEHPDDRSTALGLSDGMGEDGSFCFNQDEPETLFMLHALENND